MTTLSTTLAKRLEDPRLFRQYAYVNGKWTHGEGGREEAVYDPATNEAIGHIPLLEAEQITAAVDAAEAAFVQWRALRADERCELAGLVRSDSSQPRRPRHYYDPGAG